MMKLCPRCDATKPLEAFRPRRQAPDGREWVCKECDNARRRQRYASVAATHGEDFADEEPTNPGAPAFDDIAVNENVPDFHRLKGLSTLVDGAGNIKARWVKSVAEPPTIEHLIAVMQEAAKEWRGTADPSPVPAVNDSDLLACYVIGDGHLGAYAWPEEAGDAFDLEIAERHIVTAIDHLVGLAPAADEALIVSVGDFFHFDNSSVTTSAGTRLDGDTRWAKVLRTGVRTIRRCIDLALAKHRKVRVICEIGNHDAHSSVMLALCLSQFYERESRIEIDTSPAKFHYYRFGSTLIATTHGDTCKPEKFPSVIACDRAKDWGETTYRLGLVGHFHHSTVREFPGCVVETFPTLAPKDAWHAAAGYRSRQSMALQIFHREFGPTVRHTVGIEEVKRKAGG